MLSGSDSQPDAPCELGIHDLVQALLAEQKPVAPAYEHACEPAGGGGAFGGGGGGGGRGAD